MFVTDNHGTEGMAELATAIFEQAKIARKEKAELWIIHGGDIASDRATSLLRTKPSIVEFLTWKKLLSLLSENYNIKQPLKMFGLGNHDLADCNLMGDGELRLNQYVYDMPVVGTNIEKINGQYEFPTYKIMKRNNENIVFLGMTVIF